MENHYLVHARHEGTTRDIAYHITAASHNDAEDWFLDAKERLLDVNNWRRYSGANIAEFKLADSHSRLVARPARKGDHIRLGGGDEWAIVEAIVYDDYPDMDMETLALRLHPLAEGEETIEDHIDMAIATFVIERHATKLSAKYYRGAEPKNGETVLTTAWNGLTDGQWMSLVKGVLA